MTKVTNDSQSNREHPRAPGWNRRDVTGKQSQVCFPWLFCREKETSSFRERQRQPSSNSHRALAGRAFPAHDLGGTKVFPKGA